ncbi:hypothetical protein Tco_1250841, partial [Tanacetum coccineum]
MCPISVKEPLVKAVEVQDEGFQVVKGRNKGKKQSEKSFLVRPKTNLAYKQVPKQRMQGSWKRKPVYITKTSNSFNVLTNESSSDDEDVENGYDETTDDVARDMSNTTGASTSIENGSNVFVKWKWASNSRFCTKGSRILIGWNDNVVDVVVFSCTSQAIHTQVMLKADRKVSKDKPKPFKFFNFLAYKQQLVTEHWKMEVQGYSMFKLVKKMRFMKKPLRKLLQSQGHLHDGFVQLCHELDEVQMALDKDPSSITLREEESVYLMAFTQETLDEEHFLKQKSKIEWLQVGDTNSEFFHKLVKARVIRSRIDCITGHDNAIYEGNLVPNAFVQHYMQFIGAGPECYTSVFFKESWDVVGMDVCKAVRDFFSN